MNTIPLHPSMQADAPRLNPVDQAMVDNRGRDGLVIILDIATGKRRSATIVDAREMLALGTAHLCSLTDGSIIDFGTEEAEPETAEVAAPPKKPSTPKASAGPKPAKTEGGKAQLEDLDIHALRRLAKDAGIDGNAIRRMTKTEIAAELRKVE